MTHISIVIFFFTYIFIEVFYHVYPYI